MIASKATLFFYTIYIPGDLGEADRVKAASGRRMNIERNERGLQRCFRARMNTSHNRGAFRRSKRRLWRDRGRGTRD